MAGPLWRFFACVLFCCAFAATATFGQTPAITAIRPAGINPGTVNELRITGENLLGPTEVWIRFPGVELSATLDRDNVTATQVVCRVEVPKAAPVGIGALRLATTNGVSPIQLFMIDDLPSLDEIQTNKTIATAQPVKWPIAIDGYCDDLSFDYFKFTAKKGQSLSIDVVAQRLGSRLDPVLRVLDMEGRELAYCDDDPRVIRDSRLRCTIPAAGDYLLEIRDINYSGGPAFGYRLRMGDFPLPAISYPPFLQRNSNGLVKVLSPQTKALRDIRLDMASNITRLFIPVRGARRAGSTFVSALASDLPEALEKEPNNATNNATELSVPGAASGRFEQANDVDLYRFHAGKDQKLVFRGRTRSLGSPCDLFMSIQDEKGATIAEFDPTGPDEGVITNTFKSAGPFFLAIEELNRTGAPDLAYHITVEEWRPGFDLSLDTAEFQGRAGGVVEAKVSIARNEYSGPIELGIDSSIPLQIENRTAAEKATNATCKIKLPPELRPGTLLHFKIDGKATIGGRERTVTASTLPALRRQWPGLRQPLPELDGLVAIGVRASNSAATETKKRDDDRE